MSTNEIRILLEKEFTSKEIQTILSYETKNLYNKEKNERVIVFNNRRVLKIRKPESKENIYCKLCIGFPFPVIEFDQKVEYPSLIITYHFQGEEVRLLQTKNLEYKLNTRVKYLNSNSFKKLAIQNINDNYDESIYIDPFRFIGDSFISLRIYDKIKPLINSNSFNALSYNEILFGTFPFCDIHPIDYIKESLSTKLFIIQPDFIDDQFLNSTNLIQEIGKLEKNITLWILGRNMIISKSRETNKIDIYKNSMHEFILWDDNKEIMLTNALDSFISDKNRHGYESNTYRKEVLINPYSSSQLKNLNSLIVLSILDTVEKTKLLLDNSNTQFQSYWKSVTENYDINFRHSFNLSTTHEEIKNSDIIFTADTAVAHIANRLGKICFVIYNFDRWDSTSFLSIIHSSFLGFASHNINFIPILLSFSKFKEKEKLSTLFREFLNFFDLKHIPYDLLNPTVNYINSVVNDDKELINENRTKFINHISLDFPAFYEIDKFYYSNFSESEIQILEKEMVNFKIRIELISPTYKLALMVMKKLMTTQHSRP